MRLFSLVSVYDDCNNITEIYKNNALIRKYTYDDLQQITRENIIESGATTGKQYDFEYDLYGNILSKTESTYTVATGAITGSATAQFSYTDSTWKDLLTSCGNMSFTYDEIGNLRSLKNGSNTSGYYFNWGKGRQLESLAFGETAESAEVYVEYGYNADGIRISRTFNVGGLEYIVDGDKILKQVGCGVGVLQTLEFYYDALGEIIGFNYANQDYYFGKNLQGDVVELYQDGTLIATYEYDAWGKLLSIKDANGVTIADDINSTHVAVINPIRYRGYYYDIEKKMYYLNSRYYYPTIGRFISADTTDVLTATPMNLTDKNLYAYCDNNPVVRVDDGGEFWHVVIGAVVGAVVGVAGQFISDLATSALNGKWTFSNWQTYTGAAVGGAVGGAILGGTGNVSLANATSGFVTTGVGMSLEKMTGASDKSWAEIGVNAVADGAISYGLGKLPGVKNVTKGRNNMSAVYRSGLTKMRNKTVSHMSKRVIGKGMASGFVGGFAMDGYYGVKQFGYNRVRNRLL